jgi:protein-S-isoprenylcysteine O-methyltransferase Ste14
MKGVIFQIYCVLSLYLVTIIGRRILNRGKGYDYARRLAKFIHPIYAFGLIGFGVSVVVMAHKCPYPFSFLPELNISRLSSLIISRSLFLLSAILGLPGIAGLASRRLGPLRLMTEKFIKGGIRHHIRNPMSLGAYLFLIAYSIRFPSTYLLLATLIGLIPAHIFYLKIYEEKELELKFGEEYLKYKKETPFLLPRIKRQQKTENG